MNIPFRDRMAEATRLTRSGDLAAASALLLEALGRRPAAATAARGAASDAEVIDIQARVVAVEASKSADAGAERFTAGRHTCPTGARNFKLFSPPGPLPGPRPLVVMLHGCTQDPDDFAAGTGMNERARAEGFHVLYPEQPRELNPQRCWNWFKHSHQSRERGEPAVIASLVRALLAEHPIDARRVYVAGLSAGGAMAAILGQTHPDLFAAVGVHSGLAPGAARDLHSGLAAMRGGGSRSLASPSGVPVIVFHGDADSTVHPDNAESVVSALVGDGLAVQTRRVESGPGGRASTVQTHRSADGLIKAERWIVHGGAHAWFGGQPQGSHVDPKGPDATEQMLRFFLARSLPAPTARGV